MTDHELIREVAAKVLPELFHIHPTNNAMPLWKDALGCPTLSEYDYICRLAEVKMTDDQFESYQRELSRIVFNGPSAVTFPAGRNHRKFWQATVEQQCKGILDVFETSTKPIKLPNPDNMHGAADGFGGSDY